MTSSSSTPKSARPIRLSSAHASSSTLSCIVRPLAAPYDYADTYTVLLAILAPSLNSLFPSWDADMKAMGGSYAPPRPNGFRGAGFMRLPTSNWPIRQIYFSREALEALLRRLILALAPVSSEVGTVTRLIPSPDRKTISAVVIRSPDGTSREVQAALVIDATGTTNGSASASSVPFGQYSHS